VDTNPIRTRPVPACRLCGDSGRLIYQQMTDRSLTAPGRWDWRKCQAANCGLVWLDPVPVEDDIGKAYQGYYTHSQPEPGSRLLRRICWGIWHSYLGVRFGYTQGIGPKWLRLFSPLALLHPGGRAELDSAAMYLPAPTEPSRLLDVGCGSGVVLARMQALGWQVEGVEPDPRAAEAARTKGVPVRVGTLEPQGFPANHFDAVHSAHVLEHVHDPLRLLRESYRILKPGGTLITITPNVESWGHRQFGSSWLILDPPRHLVLFSRLTLRQAAEQAGFKIKRLSTTARNAWVYGVLTQCIRRTGRSDMSHLGKPASLLRGIGYQLRQRWALQRDPEAGDKLLLVATK
jgi:SAM-dependent methyltransferase